MKPRTIRVASAFAHYVGMILGTAVMVVAVCEGVAAVVLCFQSELDD